MALEIIWTKEAKAKLTEIIASLEEYGNDQLLQRFSQQLEKNWNLSKSTPNYTRNLIAWKAHEDIRLTNITVYCTVMTISLSI